MPVHEIACAVEAAPTRPIPQTIAPVATQLSPKPRKRRLKIQTLRKAEGEGCRKLVSVKPIPAAPHTNNPMHVVRFAPNLSAGLPAGGGVSKVAACLAPTRGPSTNGVWLGGELT